MQVLLRREALPYSAATCCTCWASSRVGASTKHWSKVNDHTHTHTHVWRAKFSFKQLYNYINIKLWKIRLDICLYYSVLMDTPYVVLTIGPSPCSKNGWCWMCTIAGRRYWEKKKNKETLQIQTCNISTNTASYPGQQSRLKPWQNCPDRLEQRQKTKTTLTALYQH